jgi:radical SAM superfamily enzyme YgiQ (UPF0313 family)
VRILLILPSDSTYRYDGSFSRPISYAPLTLTTLAALVPNELNATIRLVDEGVEEPDYQWDQWDVAGITCVASTAPRAYELSSKFRDSGAKVILGGAHPTLNPDEAARHADCVVAGPAENVWPKILKNIANADPIERLYVEKAPEILSSPVPRRDLQKRGLYISAPTVTASRGCTHRCSFCSIPKIWNSCMCARPIPEVIDEIRGIESRNILFLDPSITADRNYAIQLFEKLAPLKKNWAGLATVDLAFDRELLDVAVRSGLRGILVGFETVEQASMISCGKDFTDTGRYIEAVGIFHKKGIGVLGTFVVGFDSDTPDTFRQILKFIDTAQIDLPRFSVLTPFPGMPLFKRFKRDGRILTENWGHYDSVRVVYKPEKMSVGELQDGLIELWRKAYSGGRILKRLLRAGKISPLILAANFGFRRYRSRIPSLAVGDPVKGDKIKTSDGIVRSRG